MHSIAEQLCMMHMYIHLYVHLTAFDAKTAGKHSYAAFLCCNSVSLTSYPDCWALVFNIPFDNMAGS